jgi:hypothetical protein
MVFDFQSSIFSQIGMGGCCQDCHHNESDCDSVCCKELSVCKNVVLDGKYNSYLIEHLDSMGTPRTPYNCSNLDDKIHDSMPVRCGFTECTYKFAGKAGTWTKCYLAHCPSEYSDNPLADLVEFAATRQSSQNGCQYHSGACPKDSVCSSIAPDYCVTPTKIQMVNQWDNLSQYKVALCMGKIDDDYMPINYKPQSGDCDTFMESVCTTQSSLFTEECACIRNSEAILLKYELLQDQIGTTAACFTSTCGTSTSYQTAIMAETACNSTVCSEFIALNGASIAATGQNQIVCDNETYNLPDSTATPSDDSVTGGAAFNNTDLAFIIAIGVMFVGIFFYWLYRFLRKKYA